jgi:hypothetical protein
MYYTIAFEGEITMIYKKTTELQWKWCWHKVVHMKEIKTHQAVA